MKNTGLPQRQTSPSPLTWEPAAILLLGWVLITLLTTTVSYALSTTLTGHTIWARPFEVWAFIATREHGVFPALSTIVAIITVTIPGPLLLRSRLRSQKGRKGLASTKEVQQTLGLQALLKRAPELRPDLSSH